MVSLRRSWHKPTPRSVWPHRGAAESLNLAAAATVCLFEHARRAVGKGADLEAIISAAAHDIRSPLTAMKGFGYALEKRWQDMDEEQRTMMLAGIVHDADRMDQIVHLLVDAARVAAGSLEPMRDQVDLADLVEVLTELLARDPDHPAVSWAGDPGPYFVDKARVEDDHPRVRGIARVVQRGRTHPDRRRAP